MTSPWTPEEVREQPGVQGVAAVQAPAVELPRGGAALASMGETFEVAAATGTATATIPIAASPGRAGFGPRLAAAYDSGAGNGPLGLGWRLEVPSVSRKTDKGLPQYRGDDTFLLAGTEDLVPYAGVSRETETHRVDRYRPRTESDFSRIERWTSLADAADVHWRVTSPANVTSVYGQDPAARITDPADPSGRRIYRWLLERVHDGRGQVAHYEYVAEDGAGADTSRAHEAARVAAGGFAQRYLKRIRYGNRVMVDVESPVSTADDAWLFELVFDYGDHAGDVPTPAPDAPWPARLDPFSSYRAGFEIRTYRLLRRVLMFHRLPELGPAARLVRSTHFGYDESPRATTLRSAHQRGWTAGATSVDDSASTPALAFTYAQPVVTAGVQVTDRDTLEALPSGLAGSQQLVDLDGDGLPGLLTTRGGGWWYKRNLGEGRFAPPRSLGALPQAAADDGAPPRFADIDGDGRPELVVSWPAHGFYRRTRAKRAGWEPFRPFGAAPRVALASLHTRQVDLTGDSLPDLLEPNPDGFVWYRSLGAKGYATHERVAPPPDAREGPLLLVADARVAVLLADMTGDGLSDLVRISDRRVCYWPNLGYGRFGRVVAMSGAPRLSRGAPFDPSRLRLADVDGTGPADLVYFDERGARLFVNEAGNALSEAVPIPGVPPVDRLATADVVDFLGRGTACVVWSTRAPSARGRPLRYVDLMAEGKPWLLTGIDNHRGATTALTYGPSTALQLEDRRARRPWVTHVAFPVHVVRSVTTVDAVSEVTLTRSYRYRHPYYDEVERDFRGFAFVEQSDAETIATSTDDPLVVPPVVTRTWYHTGAPRTDDGQPLHEALAAEHWSEDQQAFSPPPLELPEVAARARRDHLRALRGAVLRQEVYSEGAPADDPEAASRPYAVSATGYAVRQEQPRKGERPAVAFRHATESVSYHYEREVTADGTYDPRVTHALTLAVDPLGVPTLEAAVAYPRRPGPAVDPEQSVATVTVRQAAVAHSPAAQDPDAPGPLVIGVPTESRSWELTALDVSATVPQTPEGLVSAFEQAPSASKSLLAHDRTLYKGDGALGILPHGAFGVPVHAHESYALACTEEQLEEAFEGAPLSGSEALSLLDADGAHTTVDATGAALPLGRWVRSGTATLDPADFYKTTSTTDAFGATTEVTWDPHALTPLVVTDALGNSVTAEVDYHHLRPWRLTDPNGNARAVAFDALGAVIALAVTGDGGEGDTLDDPTATFEYDLHALPAWSRHRAREVHQDASTRWQEQVTYFDASGEAAMVKVRAEPDPAAPASDRWVGTGRTIRNNKGAPIKQYEPFFAPTDAYETEAALVEQGVSPVVHYDPLLRPVRVELPDGTETRVDIGTWRQVVHDASDTLGPDTPWYATRKAPGAAAEDERAADLSFAHRDTPTVVHLDPLGRAYRSVADNGDAGTHETRVALDVSGNPLTITDPRGLVVQTTTFDVLDRPLRTTSADAGTTWALFDTASRPLAGADELGYQTRQHRDALGRPTHSWVVAPDGTERLAARVVYGESLDPAIAQAANLRGQPHLTCDGAGLTELVAADFEGRPLETRRRLVPPPVTQPDWSQLAATEHPPTFSDAIEPLLDPETFTRRFEWDALDRPTATTEPDGSVVRPRFDQRGQLEAVSAQVMGAAPATPFVTSIAYDAKGQRQRIAYGNGVETTYAYDPDTYRLTHLVTTSPNGSTLQDLSYTYDAVGDIVAITDGAQQTVFFDNAVVTPTQRYTYDPVHRLTWAEGREHPGQNGAGPIGHESGAPKSLPHANDGTALRRYEERYTYDASGNILELAHAVPGDTSLSWTRHYEYATTSNQLLATTAPSNTTHSYAYDARGRMTAMPHLAAMTNHPHGDLRTADLGGGGDAHYTYAAPGERTRKHIVRDASLEEQRLYLGATEVYRRLRDGEVELERWTLHIADGARRVVQVETKTVDATSRTTTPERRDRYAHGNHLGSACLETDEQARTISYEEYHPYGTTAYRAVRADLGVSPNRYRYTGMERDDETGLAYHGARYYAPWLGRWTTPDPAGLVDGPNLYRYARDNPVRWRDPSGTFPGGDLIDATAAESSVTDIEGPAPPAVLEAAARLGAAVRGVAKVPVLIGQGVVAATEWAAESTAEAVLTVQGKGDLREKWSGELYELMVATEEAGDALGEQAARTMIVLTADPDTAQGRRELRMASSGVDTTAEGELRAIEEVVSVGTEMAASPRKVKMPAGSKQPTMGRPGDSVDPPAARPRPAPELDAPKAAEPFHLLNKTHTGSLPKPKGRGPRGGRLQSHHPLQNEWAMHNLPGYSKAKAPSITLETGVGFPHTQISALQNARRNARVAAGKGKWSSSLQEELAYTVSDLRSVGFSDSTIAQVMDQTYKMLDKLGVSYRRVKL